MDKTDAKWFYTPSWCISIAAQQYHCKLDDQTVSPEGHLANHKTLRGIARRFCRPCWTHRRCPILPHRHPTPSPATHTLRPCDSFFRFELIPLLAGCPLLELLIECLVDNGIDISGVGLAGYPRRDVL